MIDDGNDVNRITTTIDGMFAGAGMLATGLPLVLFGVLAGYLSGLRDRLLLIAAAIPTAVGLLVITSQVLGSLGIEPGLNGVAVISLLPAVLVGLVRQQLTRRAGHPASVRPHPEPVGWPIWIGVVVGGGLSAAAWLPGIRNAKLPPQANDDIWHGFLTARLADLHSVTASTVAPVFADRLRPTVFYPYGLHLTGATLKAATGVTVPESLNAIWVVAIGLMLPFGVAALVRAVLPERPWAAAYAAVAAAAIPFFPYALNGLQPYTLGLSMVPALLALFVVRIRQGSARGVELGLVAGAVGLLVTHPAAAVVFVVCALLVGAEVLIAGGLKAVPGAALRLAPLAVAAALLSLPFLASGGGVVGVLPGARSQTVPSAAKAMIMVIKLQTPWTPSQPILAALVLLGVLACLARNLHAWSLLAAYLVFGLLFVGATTGASWSGSLLKPWDDDWHRLAGVLALLASVLAGMAADSIHALAATLLARRSAWLPRVALAAIAGVALIFSLGVARAVLSAQSTVFSAWHSPGLVTADDVALFKDVARRVGPGEEVLNNWQDGSTWMYAISGAKPAIPYTWAAGEWGSVLTSLSDLVASPASCRLLLDRHVTLALAKNVMVGHVKNPLLTAANAQPSVFKPVFRGPSGTIYRLDQQVLTACAGS